MIKNKLDYKLLNFALLALIVYLIYKSNDLIIFIFNKILDIFLPVIISFAIAYFIYPILEKLIKKLPKFISIIILLSVIIFVVILIFILLIPLITSQIVSLIDYLVIFMSSFEFSFFYESLLKIFNDIINNIGIYLSNGAIKTINYSINFITKLIIIIFSSIYFLFDMDKIRKYIKDRLINKSLKLYNYFYLLDGEMKKYIKGFLKIVIFSFFEYTTIYYLLGNPNFLLLGLLSSLSNFIPYFGGILVQIISLITSFVLSPTLGIKTLIFTLILSIFDSYILNPFVYKKSNKIHPLVVIFSVFSLGALLGIVGIVISVPVSIILINTYKFLKSK